MRVPNVPVYGDQRMREEAAKAMEEMFAAAEQAGYHLYLASGYRSYEEQVQLHKVYIQRERNTISPEAYAFFGYDYIHEYYTSRGKDRLSLEDATAVALSYSAAPGQSEHQSGLCIDFITMSMTGLTNEQFERTAAFRWLKENACQFGFILRYPEDKTSVTGYSYESWHYRFVGREIAMEITRRGITLEEYLAGK
jgi:D-alanyl-D-alanine carboxypeptidase